MNGKGCPLNHPLGSYWHLLGGAGRRYVFNWVFVHCHVSFRKFLMIERNYWAWKTAQQSLLGVFQAKKMLGTQSIEIIFQEIDQKQKMRGLPWIRFLLYVVQLNRLWASQGDHLPQRFVWWKFQNIWRKSPPIIRIQTISHQFDSLCYQMSGCWMLYIP